jgi:hypothetical protein
MKKSLVVLSLAGLLAACVTINIYFPAAEAQKVADQIIDDVWQIKKDEEAKEPAATDATKTEQPTAQ